MRGEPKKTIWFQIGLIAILLLVCFLFPWVLLLVGILAWTVYTDLVSPKYPSVPPPRTWRDAKPLDDDWLTLFCEGCESPAEEQFLRAMVKEFALKPNNGVLESPELILAMQVEVENYRFDFLANGRQVIEVDGAAYHSSPDQVERDRIRDEYSVRSGYKVLRIPAAVVFKSPQEAIRRVRAAIAETPSYTTPKKMTLPSETRTFAQHFNGFLDGVARFDRNVSVLQQVNQATMGFEAAIETEEKQLAALVKLTELEKPREATQREGSEMNNLAPSIQLVRDRELTSTFHWQEIVQPPRVEDAEVQHRIDEAFRSAMRGRDTRLAALKERCARDPVFLKHLCLKMVAARYPAKDAMKIVPVPIYFEAVSAFERHDAFRDQYWGDIPYS
ncbi:endonuclease domain-containing protein [Rhizobium ruizarguesonis]|uniref:endonuclease domain-containing protein n=1 Tax=Rhizobium ruizarguesonis TaxID=2081791 RepID=UPI001031389C|nr:DUF559 domain-containing protein [Rhizobium ruizarguesonis]TAU67463.1 DUF559 domain-containing protein [Rhizobium ruizarguesonis]TAV15137.1 DUF559 domain-containing protein [Rhizobium ruizarguesonis]TAV27595.1 DUF559 domain-containing protein [Rhizobium ruizarguesonis]TAW71569.1 DUF559 domain-containing protein [Rhizobium ruizarguesonis]TAW92965.1 DUF559 domain-containing protein [Rhizobium ruizarguesonis]